MAGRRSKAKSIRAVPQDSTRENDCLLGNLTKTMCSKKKKTQRGIGEKDGTMRESSVTASFEYLDFRGQFHP